MSWDPNAGNGYDNYGNYGYEQQQGQQQGQPQQQGEQQGYDMGGGYGQQQQQQPQQPQPQQPQQPQQQQGYLNPGDYGQPQQQQQQQQVPQQQQAQAGGYQPQNAYRRVPHQQRLTPTSMMTPDKGAGEQANWSKAGTPTPQGVAPIPQQQQPSAFSLPGMGDTGVNPMVANMAMEYGQNFAAKGGEELKKNLDKYVSLGQLKYYFAVDNTYVGKKLGLLLFPFTRSDWSVRYSQDEPVQPKFDVNAPDLYIPCMAYVTYVLIVGYILGLRDAFTPDLLATTASSCLVWLFLELGIIYLSLTLMNIATNLCKWDILSFSTYKYVAMIAILLSGLVMQSKTAYYVVLLYVSGALAFFLVRTLKLRIEPEVHGMQVHGKRKLYMILFYSGLQPLFIWWMTSYLVPISSSIDMPAAGGGFPFPGGASEENLDDAAPLGMMDEP